VVIDEIESLTRSREASLGGGGEPSDALRAVNALLTQLDRLKRHPNVLVLATSNLTQAIDAAFVDRADLKMYIGLPNLTARYEILCSCVTELAAKGLFKDNVVQELMPYAEYMEVQGSGEGGLCDAVMAIAKECAGLSGRALRKLPLQAHASLSLAAMHGTPLRTFLGAMMAVAKAPTEV
jgi:SpoVK/Ycf46/Vps4 family AAA+-type ATPase